MAVSHYENFPVASFLCPPHIRQAVVAIYRFARCADDIADEGNAAPAQRLADLESYKSDLAAIFSGDSVSPRWSDIFRPLSEACRRHGLPMEPLSDLLEAFRRDVPCPRYANREALLGYCRLSANPVGHLLLHLHGVDHATARRQSDCICSSLQLINFWQDFSLDLPRARVYLPEQDARRHGVDLTNPSSLNDSPATQALVSELCEWARHLMRQGADLALDLPGRAGWELRLVVQGGLRVLDKIAALEFRTLRRRPTLGLADMWPTSWQALTMRRNASLPS